MGRLRDLEGGLAGQAGTAAWRAVAHLQPMRSDDARHKTEPPREFRRLFCLSWSALRSGRHFRGSRVGTVRANRKSFPILLFRDVKAQLGRSSVFIPDKGEGWEIADPRHKEHIG